MRIHEYNDDFPLGKCIHCGEKTGLSSWQLMSMPRSMAECEKGKKLNWFKNIMSKIGFYEINCWIGYK